MLRKSQLVVLNIAEEYIFIVVVEWWKAGEKLIEYNSYEVPVHSFPVALLPDHLGSKVSVRATKTIRSISIILNLLPRKSKICEESMAFSIKDYVVWLQIPVNHV